MASRSTASSSIIAHWIPKLSGWVGLLFLGLPTTINAQESLPQVSTVEIVGSPRVIEDQVTVRIRVTDDRSRPVMGLQENNFSLVVDEQEQSFQRCKVLKNRLLLQPG
ncbi:MAG: hypothetical protein HC924_13540 [Synechococcaceae cyanobacterium SM2_3_2]|nr:hypothetical protein [Synechococcaceae cyanobacterium SM2_3_2]